MTFMSRRVLAAIAGVCAPMITLTAAQACLPGDLQSKLSQIRSNFGPIQVLSTHRPGATIAGTGKPSYHRWCRAVDFRPPPGKYGAVVAWLNANHSGGVGTYSTGHIHIDNGPYVRFSRGWSGGSVTVASSSSRGRSVGGGSARNRSSAGRQVAGDWRSGAAGSQ